MIGGGVKWMVSTCRINTLVTSVSRCFSWIGNDFRFLRDKHPQQNRSINLFSNSER